MFFVRESFGSICSLEIELLPPRWLHLVRMRFPPASGLQIGCLKQANSWLVLKVKLLRLENTFELLSIRIPMKLGLLEELAQRARQGEVLLARAAGGAARS